MKGVLLLGCLLALASSSYAVKCYNCENCETVTDDQLIDCGPLFTTCFKIDAAGIISRACGLQTCSAIEVNPGITCYLCEGDGCNGVAGLTSSLLIALVPTLALLIFSK